MRRSPLSRLALVVGFTGVAAIAACQLDEPGGLSENIGAPLLDMAVGPAPDGVLPLDTVVISASRDTITVRLRNLSPLPAGLRYQVFLVDSAKVDSGTTSNVKLASFRLITQTRSRRPVNRDSTFIGVTTDTVASTDAITAADTNRSYVLRIVDADIPRYSHVVLAIRGQGEAAPTRVERTQRFGFLFARYRSGTTYTTTTIGTFGTFAINSARRFAYTSATGTVEGFFYGGKLRLNIKNALRPPPGYQLAGWLLDTRTGQAVRLGALETPSPEAQPLLDADVSDASPWLTENGVIQAMIRGDTASLGGIRWEDFTRVLIVLEPRGGTAPVTRPGGALAFAAAVPGSVASRSPGAGKVFGTVTSGSGAARTNATIYLTGQSDRTVLQVANADAQGAFRFRTVSVGRYWAFVIPPNGMAPSDSEAVTIGTRVLNGFTVGDSVNISLSIP
jgi:hypothetical protein